MKTNQMKFRFSGKRALVLCTLCAALTLLPGFLPACYGSNNDSMSPKWRSREPPAALPAVPPLASLELEGAVRPERRSLKELNSPAAAEDSRSNGQSLAFRELGMNQ